VAEIENLCLDRNGVLKPLRCS